MATATLGHDLDSIGTVSGMVWHFLDEHGPVTLSRLAREVDAPRDLVMQGVGWLAREGKIQFIDAPRGKLVGLV